MNQNYQERKNQSQTTLKQLRSKENAYISDNRNPADPEEMVRRQADSQTTRLRMKRSNFKFHGSIKTTEKPNHRMIPRAEIRPNNLSLKKKRKLKQYHQTSSKKKKT